MRTIAEINAGLQGWLDKIKAAKADAKSGNPSDATKLLILSSILALPGLVQEKFDALKAQEASAPKTEGDSSPQAQIESVLKNVFDPASHGEYIHYHHKAPLAFGVLGDGTAWGLYPTQRAIGGEVGPMRWSVYIVNGDKLDRRTDVFPTRELAQAYIDSGFNPLKAYATNPALQAIAERARSGAALN